MKVCVVSGRVCERDICQKACINKELLKVLLSTFPSYQAYDRMYFSNRPSLEAKSKSVRC